MGPTGVNTRTPRPGVQSSPPIWAMFPFHTCPASTKNAHWSTSGRTGLRHRYSRFPTTDQLPPSGTIRCPWPLDGVDDVRDIDARTQLVLLEPAHGRRAARIQPLVGGNEVFPRSLALG